MRRLSFPFALLLAIASPCGVRAQDQAQDRVPAFPDRASELDQGPSSSAAERAAAGSATIGRPAPRRDLPRGPSSATAARAARGGMTGP